MPDADHTYSGDPDNSELDHVRFILSDTKEGRWLFSDSEIKFALKFAGSPFGAASELASIQASRYTDKRDKTVGPLSIDYGKVSERWAMLATDLSSRKTKASGPIAITTQSYRRPHFRLGMHDIHNREIIFADPRAGIAIPEDDDFPNNLDGGVI